MLTDCVEILKSADPNVGIIAWEGLLSYVLRSLMVDLCILENRQDENAMPNCHAGENGKATIFCWTKQMYLMHDGLIMRFILVEALQIFVSSYDVKAKKRYITISCGKPFLNVILTRDTRGVCWKKPEPSFTNREIFSKKVYLIA